MNINGIKQNYDYLKITANNTQSKLNFREAISKTVEQPVNLSISNEGKTMLRKMVSKSEPDFDYTNVKKIDRTKYK